MAAGKAAAYEGKVLKAGIAAGEPLLLRLQKKVGWPMGLEPTTTGITIRDSTS